MIFGEHVTADHARAELGQRPEARQRFDKLNYALSHGHGILAEMIDPASGAFVENLPQGLSHLAHVMGPVRSRRGSSLQLTLILFQWRQA
jgi:hypothetical protein